jgi:hypothetical protein
MTVEIFEHFQPLAGSDPAHSATGASGITTAVLALTPLMLSDAGALVVWDGKAAGTAVGVLALDSDGTGATLPYFKSGTWRSEDLLWPEGVSESLKMNAFAGTAISVA